MSFRDLSTKKLGLAGRLLGLAQAGVFACFSGVALADHPTGFIQVEEIGVYYSVLPAELIWGYPKGSPELTMHGGHPAGEHWHHVMVALFKGKTLDRIADAEVEVKVAEIGLAGTTKKLEPMSIADTITFGNYFYFPSLGLYRITIEIRSAGSTRAVKTSFEYKHRRLDHP